MDKDLHGMWTDINRNFFAGELQPLAAIDWGEISGPASMEAYGRFIPKAKCIIIDEQFRFDKEAIRTGEKEEAEKEKNKVECAYRLLMHEMVHQALHQKEAAQPGQHGASFLAEADRISKLAGMECPTAENVDRWPFQALEPTSEA
jgi:hypothetical protein